jgi:diguanylate cyclase
MATSLTLGRRITYLMAALASACYALLALTPPVTDFRLAVKLVELLPFLLFAHLGARLSGEVESAREQVEKLSLTDDLTALHNMRSFQALAQHMERLSTRYGRPYAICMLDSDNLKSINDRHGHLAGTQLIKWTARIVQQNIRECDVAARFGGDEFIIMFDGHEKEQILHAVERILTAMAAAPIPFEGALLRSTLSAGIASYPADAPDLRSVIMRADEALYVSKRLGKNRTTLYHEEEVRRSRRTLQVGGEQLGDAVPDLDKKGPAVDVGERDFPGEAQGGVASLLE